jgi:hypothetical protein
VHGVALDCLGKFTRETSRIKLLICYSTTRPMVVRFMEHVVFHVIFYASVNIVDCSLLLLDLIIVMIQSCLLRIIWW